MKHDRTRLDRILVDTVATGRCEVTCTSPAAAEKLRWALYNWMRRKGINSEIEITLAGEKLVLTKRTDPILNIKTGDQK